MNDQQKYILAACEQITNIITETGDRLREVINNESFRNLSPTFMMIDFKRRVNTELDNAAKAIQEVM